MWVLLLLIAVIAVSFVYSCLPAQAQVDSFNPISLASFAPDLDHIVIPEDDQEEALGLDMEAGEDGDSLVFEHESLSIEPLSIELGPTPSELKEAA